jgi:hypothetical protein
MSDLRSVSPDMAYSAATAGDAPMATPTPQRTRKRTLKPHERRALVLLAGRGAAGCTKAVMLLHGFTAEQLTKLVRAGFADTIIERAVGGAQTVLKISEAGQRALGR